MEDDDPERWINDKRVLLMPTTPVPRYLERTTKGVPSKRSCLGARRRNTASFGLVGVRVSVFALPLLPDESLVTSFAKVVRGAAVSHAGRAF